MASKKAKVTGERKDRQLNLRLTKSEYAQLRKIADEEDRDMAYVVNFFVEIGLRAYAEFGDMRKMRETRPEQIIKGRKYRLLDDDPPQIEVVNR